MAKLGQRELERHRGADILRGTVDAGDYKRHIFRLLHYKLKGNILALTRSDSPFGSSDRRIGAGRPEAAAWTTRTVGHSD